MHIDMSLTAQIQALSIIRLHDSFRLTAPPFDAINTPFSNADVAQILGISLDDISYLKEASILETTCLRYELMRLGHAYCSYWDMLSATAAMSLASVGWAIGDATAVAFDLIDEIACIIEVLEEHASIDEDGLALMAKETMQDTLPPEMYANDSGLQAEFTSTKVAVDLILMHKRCMKVFLSTTLGPNCIAGT